MPTSHYHIPDPGFTISRFVSCKTSHCKCKCYQASCCTVGIEGQGIGANANTLASAITMNYKTFVSEPGVPCLLPASMNLS